MITNAIITTPPDTPDMSHHGKWARATCTWPHTGTLPWPRTAAEASPGATPPGTERQHPRPAHGGYQLCKVTPTADTNDPGYRRAPADWRNHSGHARDGAGHLGGFCKQQVTRAGPYMAPG